MPPCITFPMCRITTDPKLSILLFFNNLAEMSKFIPHNILCRSISHSLLIAWKHYKIALICYKDCYGSSDSIKSSWLPCICKKCIHPFPRYLWRLTFPNMERAYIVFLLTKQWKEATFTTENIYIWTRRTYLLPRSWSFPLIQIHLYLSSCASVSISDHIDFSQPVQFWPSNKWNSY